ncbi:MAG: class I SAM-dependent DNA methyltransferase [Terriglobales bacterium]
MADGYDALAPVYERVFGPEAAEASWRVIQQLLTPELAPGARVLDLCCGTGEISARLLGAGYRVTGVDRSDAMLQFARQRAPQAEFVNADIRAFSPRLRYGGAVCAYNSLPHVTEPHELGEVFTMVRRALLAGGCFVFDLYPEESFRARWHGGYRAGQCLLEARCHASSRLASTKVYWPEGSTELTIRRYGAGELLRLLRQAGFGRVRRVSGGERMFWCCWERSPAPRGG